MQLQNVLQKGIAGDGAGLLDSGFRQIKFLLEEQLWKRTARSKFRIMKILSTYGLQPFQDLG